MSCCYEEDSAGAGSGVSLFAHNIGMMWSTRHLRSVLQQGGSFHGPDVGPDPESTTGAAGQASFLMGLCLAGVQGCPWLWWSQALGLWRR